MDDFFHLSLKVHLVSIFFVMLFSIIHLLITNLKDEQKALKYLWNILPLHYCLQACVIFSGLILIKFVTDWIMIFVMSLVWVFVLVGTIKTYKWMKICRQDKTLAPLILKQIRKKYLIDIVLIVLLIFVS